MNANRTNKYAAGLAVTTTLIVGVNAANADIVWSGFVDGDWQDSMNWVGNVVPMGAIGDLLRFDDSLSGDYTITGADDMLTDVRGFTFGAGVLGTYVIDGTGSLEFADGFAVTNLSTLDQTLNVDLIGRGNDLGLDASGGNLIIGGTINLFDATTTLLVSGDFDTTINGVISDAGGGLTKSGDGTLILNGANDYSGGTQFDGGTIVAGNDLALGTGDLVLGASATLTSDVDGRILANDINVGTFSLIAGGATSLDLQGVISGTGGLSKTGGSRLTLSSANDYMGDTQLSGGTIILGDDDALGTTGDLVVNASGTIESDVDGRILANDIVISAFTLSVGGTTSLELQGLISGNGGLSKKGTGDLLMSGVGGIHTYLGQTTVQDGLLQVDNDALPDAGLVNIGGAMATLELLSNETIGALANGGTANGVLELNGNTLTLTSGASLFGGVIQGTGGLNLTGTDLVLLSGANTFTGGTTLTADGATLGLGSDMALSTGDLTLMSNATLLTSGGPRTIANNLIFATPGASTLTFEGSDPLRLDGTVDMGGMEQTFEANQATTIAGVISNGSMRKTGTFRLTLSGANTFAGDLNVDAGRLILDGSLAGNTFVNTGGRLSGGGVAMGNLTVASGATMEPGNGQGTFTVGGNYLQQTGSTLRVELDAINVTSDLLDVTGTATLESGSTIAVSIDSPDFIRSGQIFEIINADGGIFDAGALVDTSSVTLQFDLQRQGGFVNGDTSYSLQAVRDAAAFSDPANAGNNKRVGLALDMLIPIANSNPTGEAASLLGRLDPLDATGYNQALVELSPERHNAATQLGIDGATDFTGMQTGYLSARRGGGDGFAFKPMGGPRPGSLALSTQDPYIIGQAIEEADNPFGWADLEPEVDRRYGAFARGFGVFSEQDTNGNRTGYDSDAYGAGVGVDYRFTESLIGGIAFAYTSNNADYNQALGGIDVDSLRIGPYMTWVRDDLFVDASLSFGSSSYDSRRSIPTLGLEASGDYDGFDVTGYIGTGYDWRIDNTWSLRPTASLQYSYFDFDSFTETGAPGANMSVAGRDSDSLRSRISLAIQYLQTNGGFWQGVIGWQHEFLDNDDVEAAFAVGGNPFTVDAGNRDETAFFFGGGFGLPISDNGFAYLRFEALRGDDTETKTISGGVSFRF